jgi:hypothetical protein
VTATCKKNSVDLLDPGACEAFVSKCFANHPERLGHILAVADRSRQSARDINELYPQLFVNERLTYCAALLHDIGYWEEIASTGVHLWDGYNFVKSMGYHQLARLIISHSCSPEEAKLAGIPDEPLGDSMVAKIITYWDMQIKRGGEIVSYDERYYDIVGRYGEFSIIGRANTLARERIKGVLAEVETLLHSKD